MKSDVTPGMNPLRAKKFREVEAEFDEPFWDVVKGFAEMGYGKNATAKSIGYSWPSFSRLVAARGDIPWKPLRVVLSVVRSPMSQKHRFKLARERRSEARRYFVLGQWRPISDICRISGLSKNGIRKRIVSGVKGDALAAPPIPQSARACGGRRAKGYTWWQPAA